MIIGGGVIGTAVALALTEQGATVRVLEMRGVGRGATQASAGMLAPYIEGHGDALLTLGVAALGRWDGFVDQVSAASGLPIEYSRCGSMQVAHTAAHAEYLASTTTRLRARGVAHEWLDGAEARRREPALSHDIRQAVVVPGHGYVHVGQLMAALERASVCRGVSFEQTRVMSVSASASGVRLETDHGTIDASTVVVASGSWSSEIVLDGQAALPVRPIRGQLAELQFPQPPVSTVVWGEGCYLVPWRSGALLVGATVEDVGFDESSTESGVRSLVEAAARAVPACVAERVEHVRVGLRPATADELPIIGWSSSLPRVFYATGHYRNGVLLAPLTAALVAAAVSGTTPDEWPVAPDLVAPARLGL